MDKKITFQVESATALIEEIRPLLQAHYEEIARHRDKIALNPDYSRYEEMDRQGLLHAVTVRDEGRLVGYYISFVVPHLHYMDHLMALNDIVFISKPYRKGFTAIRMFKFAEASLRARGVSKTHINIKLAHDFGPVLERIGFVEIERIYEKILI